MKDRTILLNGFSKAYAMTGWRLGYAAGNKEIIEAMMKIHQYIMLCAPITAQMAAMEALRTNDEVERMVSEYNRRRRLMGSVFGACGEGFIRCAYAVSQYEIKEALDRIGRFLEKWEK